MKRGLWIVILSLLLILVPILFGLTLINLNLKLKTSSELNAEIVSGKASQSNVAMAISVIGPPYLQINSPLNGTYLISQGIPLNFESEGLTTWYNLNEGENITLNGNININASSGNNVLYLFANNSYGLTQKQVSFTINATRVKVILDGFNKNSESNDESQLENQKKDKKGETTQILDYTLEQLQQLDNFVLDDVLNGKIEFNEPVNLTDNEDFIQGVINFTKNVNISYNFIRIKSESFPGLNKPAVLTLNDLTFSNPRILKDGEVCSDLECVIMDYSRGDLIFLVSGFSTYSAEETPEEEIPIPERTSGGGGGIFKRDYNFKADQEQFSIKLKQGDNEFRILNITNYGKQRVTLTLEGSPAIDNFLKFNQRVITLNPGESKLVEIDFFVREDANPNLYLGEILLKTDTEVEKRVLIALEITSSNPLFDVRIYVPEKYLAILPGDEVYYTIEIFNLGDIKDEVDVEVEYNLMSTKGEIVTSSHESMAVRTKLSYIRNKKIPDHLPLGEYLVYVTVKYSGEVASASQSITLGKHEETEYPLPSFIYIIPLMISMVALVMLILLLVILIRLSKKKPKFKRIVLKKVKRR
ncbi:MAG TPA: hypothetical protein PLK34_00265 [Candidatus Pacearchaeota archaeon]|nr:hypothetical protein [Candidatus Pacearchaeota archaeon]